MFPSAVFTLGYFLHNSCCNRKAAHVTTDLGVTSQFVPSPAEVQSSLWLVARLLLLKLTPLGTLREALKSVGSWSSMLSAQLINRFIADYISSEVAALTRFITIYLEHSEDGRSFSCKSFTVLAIESEMGGAEAASNNFATWIRDARSAKETVKSCRVLLENRVHWKPPRGKYTDREQNTEIERSKPHPQTPRPPANPVQIHIVYSTSSNTIASPDGAWKNTAKKTKTPWNDGHKRSSGRFQNCWYWSLILYTTSLYTRILSSYLCHFYCY